MASCFNMMENIIVGEKIKNIGSQSQIRKMVWLNESIEVKKKSKKLASGFVNGQIVSKKGQGKKIKKISKWLQYKEIQQGKIKNVGSLSQVRNLVLLMDSIQGIEANKIKKIGKWLHMRQNIIVGEKKNQKYWQFVSGQ